MWEGVEVDNVLNQLSLNFMKVRFTVKEVLEVVGNGPNVYSLLQNPTKAKVSVTNPFTNSKKIFCFLPYGSFIITNTHRIIKDNTKSIVHTVPIKSNSKHEDRSGLKLRKFVKR